MEIMKKIALVFTIIGALNWGLVGLFKVNLVTLLIKSAMIVNIIYTIIGIASLICIAYFFEEKMTHQKSFFYDITTFTFLVTTNFNLESFPSTKTGTEQLPGVLQPVKST